MDDIEFLDIPSDDILSTYSTVRGDMFSPELHTDGLAIFVPCGMTSLRLDAESFIRNHGDSKRHIFIDRNPHNFIYPTREVRRMVTAALDELYEHGARRIAMNAIRTTAGAGESERRTEAAVIGWLLNHPSPDIHIYLVDKRGGFNR